ncbi:hypothetical protein VL4N_13840 [Vagococcus lutrae]|uniref:hypothetical protein n=1 Tax=Vagococcus lutrae TaxID=81947 RepID=UPI001927F867|nr:hypothetical protein [Vagococcus lutrae]GEQ62010.1 hypothetical protein VL2N_13460 [Vagococcus lutrae]GEQ63943.1 hypothetical protein VL3N_13850 [Vagococcus lutrae]GEQ65834.1 hypothetical protein VL4N_13840 [Vagococcus lutrae]
MKNNLINQTVDEIKKTKLENMTPLERLMWYRNSDVSDIDRGSIALKSYEEQGFCLDRNNEPDTFFISAYNDLTNLLRSDDKNFYEGNFKEYIEELGIDYGEMSNSKAQYYRKKWFVLDSTIKKYSQILENKVVNEYITATHILGNFMVIPKWHGQKKCQYFNDKGVQYLEYLEKNWEDNKKAFKNISSYKEYVKLSKIENLYDEEFKIKEIYLIDYYNDDWDVTLGKMKYLTEFVNERNNMILEQHHEG